MIKKVLFIGGGAVALTVLVYGGAAISYMQTSAHYLSESVENAVPVEFQIQRAKEMIKDLEPQVRKNMHVIAKEEAQLERLEQRIEASEASSERDEKHIMRLKDDLTNETRFVYAGRSYSKEQVKIDLANRFKRFKTDQSTLDSLHRVYEARRSGLEAARTKLEGLRAAQGQLAVEVANLEAQRQMVAAAKTTANYHFDDSKLGRIKELISDLQLRLDTERKLVDADVYFPQGIPLDEVAPEDIVDQVTEYFGPDKPEAANLVQQ